MNDSWLRRACLTLFFSFAWPRNLHGVQRCPLTLEQYLKPFLSLASVNTSDLPGSSKSCSTSPCLETSPSAGFRCMCSQRLACVLPIEGIPDLLFLLCTDSEMGIWGNQSWGGDGQIRRNPLCLEHRSWSVGLAPSAAHCDPLNFLS